MATVNQILEKLNEFAPFQRQMDFDNSGFLVGDGGKEVHRILIGLDITCQVVQEACQWGAELILSHHPVIFHPMRAVTWDRATGAVVCQLIQNNVAAICAHTNLDLADQGVNTCLGEALGLSDLEILQPCGVDEQGRPYGLGRMGRCHQPGCTLLSYVQHIGQALNTSGIRFTDGGRPVCQVAVGGGACGSLVEQAVKMGCDTLVTGDVKHDQFLLAQAQGLNLVDAGHYATEQVVCARLAQWCAEAVPQVEVRLSQVPGPYQTL